jgi:hypothetical protein
LACSSFSLRPEVNRREIDLIWSRCHLKDNGTLELQQFLREFGYSKRSAHYPNAKWNPPERGDADCLLTSRKLYGDTVLVQGATLNVIRTNAIVLKDAFVRLDRHRTGHVKTSDFDRILTDVCPSIGHDDLYGLRSPFEDRTRTK